MYLSRIFNRVRPIQCQARLISNYPTLRDSKAANKPTVAGEPAANSEPAAHAAPAYENETVNMGRKWITPSNKDKKILVWMKYYKSIDEVPDRVKYETMDKAQNRFRIRCCNWMMIFTLVCFFISVKWGKRRAEQGVNLETINTTWHNKINDEYQAELNAAKKAKAE